MYRVAEKVSHTLLSLTPNYYHYLRACVVSSLCAVYCSSPATLRLPSTTLAILSQPTHRGRESVDQ